jgi:putative endonuclease
MSYIYVIMTNNFNRYYIGVTNDLNRRLGEHNEGLNKSTRGKEWILVYIEGYISRSFAERREQQLKRNGRMRQFLIKRIRESLK